MATHRPSVTVDTIVFNGIAFRRYPDSPRWSDRRYYRPTGTHIKRGIKNLHREIWQAAHGAIPPGWVVHHKDGNALNNELANLEALPAGTHRRHHAEHLSEAVRAAARARLDTIRPLAAAWHRSAAGRQWHREHGQRRCATRAPRAYACAHCGKAARSSSFGKALFCSNACRAAARRRSGKDHVRRTCLHCGQAFTVDRYQGTQTCSRSCAAFVRWARRRVA
jgi:hypothetical protein